MSAIFTESTFLNCCFCASYNFIGGTVFQKVVPLIFIYLIYCILRITTCADMWLNCRPFFIKKP
jgi:hypothetical protein